MTPPTATDSAATAKKRETLEKVTIRFAGDSGDGMQVTGTDFTNTAAVLGKLAGARVALGDARTVGSGVTAGTTAHVTEAIDTRYRTLEDRFGEDGARMAAQSSRAAIERRLGRPFDLPGDLERVMPSFKGRLAIAEDAVTWEAGAR